MSIVQNTPTSYCVNISSRPIARLQAVCVLVMFDGLFNARTVDHG